MIATTQSTFVKDRQILDGVLVANELVDSRIRSKKPGILFKADFEKAYDHVNWRFVEWVMKEMGFDNKWVHWIQRCVTSVSFSILINGEIRGFFKGERGLRQGDPLSPFLFTLVMQVMSLMIDKAATHKAITGFQVKSQGIAVTHLQFADDSLFFLDANIAKIQMLQDLLITFEVCSGLHVNFSKSAVFSVGNQANIQELANVLKCKVGKLPTVYLGLPLGASNRKKEI